MSDERYERETVSDIMSEMRGYADSMEKHLIYDLSECSTDYLRVLADRIEAAEMREIETIRAFIEGLLKASSVDCASCGYDCGPLRENCITKQAIAYLEGHS